MEKIKSMLENAAVSGIDVWNPMEYQMERLSLIHI